MSKRQYKSQASSSRVASGAGFGGFGSGSASSSLSYLSEPPNFSTISDANVVVAFKNLLKKDSITKAKGLEDLRSHVQAHPYEQDGGIEQPVLEAWVKLYPRIAIDNSRRVRELSHNLQYELLKSARKRMEKHIPSIVGAWLAGTYDRDRPVSRAASDGITSFLDSDDKVLLFWRRCQTQILEYAQESLEETPQTLSDERTVSADDAEAKYDRVIGASLSLVVNLLAKLSKEDTVKSQAAYEAFLVNNNTLWKFIAAKDAFVRRTTVQLLLVCLERQQELIENDLELLSSAFIGEGLRASQVGSALLFVQALCKITTKHPNIWTSSYKNKKSALSRLRQFVQKGSQGGPAEFWQVLSLLILRMPNGVLPSEVEGASEFLKGLRDGISSREEARSNVPSAWTCYFEVVEHFGVLLSDNAKYLLLLESSVYPVFEQFIRPSPELSRFSIGSSTVPITKAFHICEAASRNDPAGSFETKWKHLGDIITAAMLTSLPEQSKDFVKSQNAVVSETSRWFGLQAEIIKTSGDTQDKSITSSIPQFLVDTSTAIVARALELLINRNSKPYGAAGAMESALRLTPTIITSSPTLMTSIVAFLEDHLPGAIYSPSSSQLLASLQALRSIPEQKRFFESIWQATMDGLLALPADPRQLAAVQALIALDPAGTLSQRDMQLQSYLFQASLKTVESEAVLESLGEVGYWELFENTLAYHSLSDQTAGQLVKRTLAVLDDPEQNPHNALRALEVLAQKRLQVIEKEDPSYVTTTTRLLSLLESGDNETASRAAALKATLGRSSIDASDAVSPIHAIIKTNLEAAGPQSLSIDTLARQARTLLQASAGDGATDLFPAHDSWSSALEPLLSILPNPSLALINDLGGAVSMIEGTSNSTISKPQRDSKGHCIALRMALYTTELLRAEGPERISFRKLPLEKQNNILHLLALTAELANDQLSLKEGNKLWASATLSQMENEIVDFIPTARLAVTDITQGLVPWKSGTSDHEMSPDFVAYLIEKSRGRSLLAYYSARSLAQVMLHLYETNGGSTAEVEGWLSSTDLLKSSTLDTFTAVAVLASVRDGLISSKIVSNLCNRLVSDVTGASASAEKTLSLLVYLNATMSVYSIHESDGSLPVAQNRLVFAVKQITTWMSSASPLSSAVAAEAVKCLWYLLPCIKEVYGPHWEVSIGYCASLPFQNGGSERLDDRLPSFHASLKLILILKGLQDINDDLEETLLNTEESVAASCVQLLKLPRRTENQPWNILDGDLYRQIAKTPLKHFHDLSEIYPRIAAEQHLVQAAAFDILHRSIPAAQEQLSVDVLLEKRNAQLPEELLSLLLDAPSMQNFLEETLASFPASIRGYLLSWHLIYDSFTNASYKVRNDYSEILKSEDYITPLLDFTFDVLGHSAAAALNLDKARFTPDMIRAYDLKLADSEPDEYNMQWLLIHLYYLCLKFTPNLAKNWWMNCKSKQTRIAVEAWTEKYFSPLVIADTLDEVETWAGLQEAASDDEKELIVKLSKKSREVYAGYEVDELQMQIVIQLPAMYPLEGVKVAGINRVAVSEKKWQSWLMITQGVITFSNGSITDGLTTFRKNVTGALKGQTECAICYSIISSDKKMPDKRCSTCKNLFHSSCLFKWFASSNQSTCPLCRNPFNYGTDVASRARRRGGPEE